VGEWTCEANPATVSRAKVRALLAAGVNRVSVGVQSFQPDALRFLGRPHRAEDAERTVALLREEGVRNLSLDLMHGLPGATAPSLASDLDRLVDLRPQHVSCYELTLEPGTPLHRRWEEGSFLLPGDDEALGHQETVRGALAAAGYRHYEISNFALPGYECRHNLLYWGGGEYIGCGPSAHSHWGGARWANTAGLDDYIRAAGTPPRAFEERLDAAAKARETLVMGLRRVDGVDRSAYLRDTGFDYRALVGPPLRRLVRLGLLEDAADRLRLTAHGRAVSNAVFAELV
jgi:oxygen-independent coproporphyrinogen-3 oxidase